MRGFVALSTVLIISAVMLVVVATVTYLSIGEAQSSLALELGENNLALVEGCVEDLLVNVRNNSVYSVGSLTRPEGTCTFTYNAGTSRPVNWDVTVNVNATDFQRKVRVIFVRNGTTLTMTSWQEV